MEKIETTEQSAQEVIDNCEEKLTSKEIAKMEFIVDKDLEKEVKEIVKKLN